MRVESRKGTIIKSTPPCTNQSTTTPYRTTTFSKPSPALPSDSPVQTLAKIKVTRGSPTTSSQPTPTAIPRSSNTPLPTRRSPRFHSQNLTTTTQAKTRGGQAKKTTFFDLDSPTLDKLGCERKLTK